MGEEDRVDVGQPDRAQQLLLGALAAVEQDPLAAARSSSAGRPRRAVGTDPAVPAKKSERSMRLGPAPGSAQLDELEAIRPSSTVARPIVWRGWRRLSVGEPGLKIAKPSARSSSGMCEWPKTTASASGKRRRIRARRPAAGPASWSIAIRTPPRATGALRQHVPEHRIVRLPNTAWTGGPSASSPRSTGASTKSPACRIASASRNRSSHAAGSAGGRAAVRVGDDRQPHFERRARGSSAPGTVNHTSRRRRSVTASGASPCSSRASARRTASRTT